MFTHDYVVKIMKLCEDFKLTLQIYSKRFRLGCNLLEIKNLVRIGYELGYAENLNRPTDLRSPDHSTSKPMTLLKRLYIRAFGIPDTIKQQQAREVLGIVNKLSFSSVLDIRCAQGHYSIRIARKYPNSKVKGIDINKETVDVGRRVKMKYGLKNIMFKNINICTDFINEKYDLVLLLQVIEHLRDDAATLKKLDK